MLLSRLLEPSAIKILAPFEILNPPIFVSNVAIRRQAKIEEL